MSTEKTGFSSRIGFILAAAGSAVGLGNIWRFPYLAAQYGGGIFLLVYLVLVVTFGFSLMITEIAIGRKTGKSPIDAFRALNKKGTPIGFLVSAVPMIILPYYCVIGGWVIKYGVTFVMGQGSAAAADGFFNSFIGSTASPLIFAAIYIFLTAAVVLMGVQKGIENISKILMPVLLVLTVGISIYGLTLDGAMEGVKYYLIPNFSNFSLKTVVAAMGQLFYSMSLAMGIMITYGSYMPKKENLESSVRQIEIFDTSVAFLAGLMIIPAVFAFSGGDSSALGQGPGLMFVTLPKVFNTMPGGNIVGIVFFVLVLFAALTSSISLMETVVSIFRDKFRINRKLLCILVMIGTMLVAIPSSIGYGLWDNVLIFGKQILDFFDFLSNNIMMPIAALLTCLFVAYVVKTKTVEDEVEQTAKFKSKTLYRVMIKYVCPVFLVVILISSLVGYV